MTKETKAKLLDNALDFKKVAYTKYYVKETNQDFEDWFDTEQEALEYIEECKQENSSLQLYIDTQDFTISKEELINTILKTIS